MTTHYLDKLFNPASIAVIGASDNPDSVGMKVFHNLLAGEFAGKLYGVNPKYQEIQGQRAYASVKKINHSIDLAIIITPANTVAQVISECGEKGIRAAIILSAGFAEIGDAGKMAEQSLLTLAAQYRMRLVGPNCLGMMRPHLQLNATFDNNSALEGHIALVSQSGAIAAAILDWACDKQIGFSTMLSLGNAADLDFGEILDFLALDAATNSILLYIEGIHNARHFMSGLRAAARMKPVIVIKGGRYAQGTRAAQSHTGALVGDDDVFDSALRRAGAVRVLTIEQLFSAAAILSSNYRSSGNRLAIITNGGGAGVMAADRASELNVKLPQLSDKTLIELNKILPESWSHHNPVDILGDATPERYHAAHTLCRSDENIDGLLSILVPVALSKPLKVAEQVIADAQQNHKPLLACWMGEKNVKSSRELFAKHNIPYFHTPESAVEAFSYLAAYQNNQQLLLQVPEPLSAEIRPDVKGARLIIEAVLAEKRRVLTMVESKAILQAFAIPVTQAIETHSATEALIAAESVQFPVVMKINSPDITHKRDADGVQLNITDAESVRNTFNQLINNAKKHYPEANISGITVERMYKNNNNRELMIGVIRDKVFGPVITFGAGGSFVEILRDRAVALPPLNQFIAKQLINRTRVAKLLGKFRNMPAVNIDALVNILLRVSEMVCELPHIEEMDINPLIINDKECIAVDARIVVNFTANSTIPYQHMAICPYPNHLISQLQLPDGSNITIRPIRPEDATIEQNFVRNLSEQTKIFRFMEHLQELTLNMLVRFTQIDYDREMALIATCKNHGEENQIGVARYIINSDQESCEFSMVIADQWQHKGIGTHLLTVLIDIAKAHNLKTMAGEILSRNEPMLKLVKQLDFVISSTEDAAIKTATKDLR